MIERLFRFQASADYDSYTVHYAWHKKRRVLRGFFRRALAACSNPAPRVLDIGCGDGFDLFMFRQLPAAARCSRFVGLDLNEDDIAYCKARLEYEGDDRLEFRVQDVVAEPLRSEDAAEIVVCSEVVEHLEKPEALLENIADVLPCGGYLILTTPNGAAWSGRVRRALGWVPPTTDGHGHISVYGRKEWRRRCRRAGLVLVTERRGSIAYGAVGIDRRRVLAGALIASDAVFDLLRLKDLSWETLQLYRKD